MNLIKIKASVALVGVLMVMLFNTVNGQIAKGKGSYWQTISLSEVSGGSERYAMPSNATIVRLNLAQLKSVLSNAPKEFTMAAAKSPVQLSVPMPNGSFQNFRMVESQMMEPGLQAQYPDFKVYSGQGVEDPTAVVKVSITDLGFESMIISPNGQFFVDPFHQFNTLDYVVYEKSGLPRRNFTCETASVPDAGKIERNFTQVASGIANRSSGGTLKTYRLALACTGEYSTFFGGTASGAMSGIIASIARVNGVYEMELAVRLVLIANDNLLVYLNSATDPYTNNNGSTMLTENQNNITTVIGSANYDIGHVFSTGGGGVAGLGVVCSSTNKSRGVTGSSSPTADAYDIDYVAHEMGHQFSGNHTFNSALGSCAGGNRNATTAYEPGSGITIMAYAGICGADDLAAHSIAYFHVKSGDEIGAFITTGGGNTCPVATATGNTPPTVAATGTGYNIPISTPFKLTATGSDADGDIVTYSWEEYDLGAAGVWNPTTGTGPLFRPFSPTTDSTRTFPKMSDIVNNVTTIGEFPASYARTLNFRVTARDNRAGGGGVTNTTATTVVNVINTTTPFKVTAPNTAVTWPSGSSQTVTWDVSSTNTGTINCANVKISLSTDGGFTYPTVLLASTANDGSEVITVPSILTTTARVKVEAVGNIFFDISNVNFTIVAGSSVLTTLSTTAISGNAICSGQSINISFIGDGNANAGNVYSAQLSNSSGSFASPVTIGTLSSTASSGTITCAIPVTATTAIGYKIRVIASNPSVIGSDNGSILTYNGTLGTVGGISGSTTVCQGQTGVVYTVPTVANATGYNWTVPSGSTITSGSNTNTITVTISTSVTSGTVTVTPITACSTGNTSSLSLTISLLPATPGAITGPTSSCANNTLSYSIVALSGATGYTWTFPAGFTIQSGANTNSVVVLAGSGAVSGTISVTGTFSCGSGPASTLSIAIESPAATPAITASGSTTICNSGNVTLSVTSPIVGVNYQWRKDGINISGANGTNYSATSSGNYDVTASNAAIPAQTFTNTNRYSIPDASCTGAVSVIPVTGYIGTIDPSKIYVKINITHTYDGDLAIYLQSPSGEKIGLSNLLGSSGDNFTNTVFADSASIVLPSTGSPYTGLYKPSAAVFTVTGCTGITTTKTTFGSLGSGINPNGNWSLYAYDRASIDTGAITSWVIGMPLSGSACPVQSNSIAVSVIASPTVSAFTPSSGSVGTVVSISGSNFSGATDVKFNGVSATSFTVVSSGQINATVPAGASTGLITVYNGICNGSGASNFTIATNTTLNLKVFIQGFYQGSSSMAEIVAPGKTDTITVQLRNSTSPFGIAATATGVLNSNGTITLSYPGFISGNSYYIAVRHRNSIETWSKLPVPFSGTTTFDFTVPGSLRPAINPMKNE
jgi:subtilisin-like proprotein convertase family protein